MTHCWHKYLVSKPRQHAACATSTASGPAFLTARHALCAGNDGEGGIEDVLDIDLDEIDDDVQGQVSMHWASASGDACWSLAPCVAWQKEMPSLEDIIEEERSYFLRTDRDGDSKLNKAEFVRHFLDSMGANRAFLFPRCSCSFSRGMRLGENCATQGTFPK